MAVSPSKRERLLSRTTDALKKAGHDAIARDLEADPHGAGMALVTLEERIRNAGTMTPGELRSKKLLEHLLFLEEDHE
jgi:hypothetical protein